MTRGLVAKLAASAGPFRPRDLRHLTGTDSPRRGALRRRIVGGYRTYRPKGASMPPPEIAAIVNRIYQKAASRLCLRTTDTDLDIFHGSKLRTTETNDALLRQENFRATA